MVRCFPLVLAVFLCGSASALPQRPGYAAGTPGDTVQKSIRIYNTARLSTGRPTIDGRLDDACWKTGEWAGLLAVDPRKKERNPRSPAHTQDPL
jgi:hypothetical protein